MSFTNNGLSENIKAVAKDILEGKAKQEEFVVPEDVAKEDVSDFVVAASAAKKAGKKKFKFGGKEFPVTIKTDVPTEEKEEDEEDKEPVEEAKKVKEEDEDDEEEGNVDNDIEVNPEIEEGKKQVKETGVAGETPYGKLKKYDSEKHEDDVETVDNLPEGAMKKMHQMMDDGKTAEEIAKALKVDVKTIKKLMSEDKEFHPDHFLAIKEVFEEFMSIEEGTMASGIFSRNKAEAEAAMDALKDLMRKKLPVGRDGSRNAIEDKMYSIVFDDELFDDFAELRDEKGEQADARPLIRARLKQLRVRV